jgi:hypothetical protein
MKKMKKYISEMCVCVFFFFFYGKATLGKQEVLGGINRLLSVHYKLST